MTQREPDEQKDLDLGIARLEIKELKQALAEEKEKAEKNLANWQRAQADLANYRRRVDLEKEELAKFGNAGLILSLLPFLDDLERALSPVPDELENNKWVEGVKLIERKFMATLEKLGVSAIKALGEPFDPRFHDAIREETGEEGVIVGEVQKGYMFNEKVLRPSKVVVGDGAIKKRADSSDKKETGVE
jgi:molecular chaperone GrpE